MKLSELKPEQYTLESPEERGGGALAATYRGVVGVGSRVGVGVGTEIGKGGLGLSKIALQAAAKATGAVGLERASRFATKAAEATEAIKKKVYEEPFKKELETGAGKFGEFLGVGAEFLAPSKAIISGQKILSALAEPVVRGRGRVLRGAAELVSRAAPEAVGAGGVEYARTGGDWEKAKEMGYFAGGISGVTSVLGGLAKATYWPELADSATRALGVQGKTTGGRILPQTEKKVAGLGILKKYASEIKVKDDRGVEKAFEPTKASFHEVLQAWNETRKMIFNKYSTISEAAGKKIEVAIDDVAGTLSEITKGARTGNYKSAARSILQDLVDNFGKIDDEGQFVGFRPVSVKELETYLSDLYGEASSFIAGRADKAHGEIAAATAKKIKDLLDDAIEGLSGSEYGTLRQEYSSLKSIEQDLVRRFQQEARQLGGGLTDYVNIFASGDVIGGILSSQPALIAKGLTQGALGTLFRALKRPDRYLQRSFKLIDERAVDPVMQRLLGAGRALSEREQKIVDAARGYLTKPKVGMGIEDISQQSSVKEGSLLDSFLSKWVRQEARLKQPSPQEIEKMADEARAFKPSKSVILYRGTKAGEGDTSKRLSSWTYNKEAAQMHAEEGGGEVIKRKISPDEILVDSTTLPPELQNKYGFIDEEEEVILRPLKDRGVGTPKATPTLTTSFLDYAEQKIAKNPTATLSRQEILDFARRPELKKGEADLLNNLAKDLPEGKIPAQEFADSIRRDLLELKPVKVKDPQYESMSIDRNEDAGFAIGDNLGKNYEEVVFESPITTNGSSHYPNFKNYFAHARGDEVKEGGKKIWRDQEIQADALQKEGLERAKPDIVERVKVGSREFEVVRNRFGIDESTPKKFSEFQMDDAVSKTDMASGNGVGVTALDGKKMTREEAMQAAKEAQKVLDTKSAELDQLSPFTNDRFGERIMRERIKEKALKGYSKYRIPTGETIGKIEGFQTRQWVRSLKGDFDEVQKLTPENMKTGDLVGWGAGGEDWIITDILGDGRFKAIQKDSPFLYPMSTFNRANPKSKTITIDGEKMWYFEGNSEAFDLTGKSNPQYRRYENWGKFLKNKYGAELIKDKQGNTWYEANISGQKENPVYAFGKAKIGALVGGAGVSAVGGLYALEEGHQRVFAKQTKEEALKRQPFGEEAKKQLEEVVFDVLMDAPQEGVQGVYTPKGAALHNAIIKYVGPFSEKATNWLLEKSKFLQQLDKANIDVLTSSPTIMTHEILHHLFEGSAMGPFNKDLSPKKGAEDVGYTFMDRWEEIKERYPDLQAIDKHLDESYPLDEMNVADIATERFAYLGERGPKHIPPELVEFYKDVFTNL